MVHAARDGGASRALIARRSVVEHLPSTDCQHYVHAVKMRNHAIDGLRAIAMTMVIAQHCGLMPFGWTGVWLFFVISGYVITRGFISGTYRESSLGASYLSFMGRRAIRIVPVYLLYLLTCLLAALAIEEPAILSDLPYLLSFTYNWQMMFEFWPSFGNFGPLGHLWTLSIEQQFYLGFGVLALCLSKRSQLTVSLILIGVGPLVRWWWSTALDSGAMTDAGRHAFGVYAATHCHLDAFLMGSVVARTEPALRARPRCVNRWSLVALATAAVYGTVYVLLNRSHGATGINMLRNVFSGILYGQLREVFVYLVVDLLAVVILIRALVGGFAARLLATRFLAGVGRISYGGYLFHAFILWAAHEFVVGRSFKELEIIQRVQVFLASWLVTVAVAAVSYHWFELPLSRRWSEKRHWQSSVALLTRPQNEPT